MKKTENILLIFSFLLIIAGGIWLTYSSFGKKLTANIFSLPSNMVTIQTRLGDIHIELFYKEVPEMSKNFRTLAKQGKYDGIPFHRVIKNFMIQTGDFENKNGTGGTSYLGKELPDEISQNLSHKRGMVSMANRGKNTNGSQFFILEKDALYLDGAYSIFGQVTKGMDIVDKIANIKTDNSDRPVKEILMDKVIVK